MRLVARPFAAKASLSASGRPGSFGGRIRPPGDKSISHRALMLGAVAAGETRIEGLLEGADVLNTAAAMAALGANLTQTGVGTWRVVGRGADGLVSPARPLDFGNSGTGARLAMGLIAGHPVFAVFCGDQSLSGRPMRRILGPLAQMGAVFLARDGGLLPAAVQGRRPLTAIDYQSPTASAQIKSAVLLAGLNADGVTSVTEPHPSRDHSERMGAAFGATITSTDLAGGARRVTVRGGAALQGQRVVVPADPSSAAFAAAAAALLPGGDVLLEDVCLNPLRFGFFETLKTMGAAVSLLDEDEAAGERFGLVRVRHRGGLKPAAPAAETMAAMIDEVPILAALAAFAEGVTVISGAQELRVKESDRLAMMARGLRACGVGVEERPDGLVIEGGGLGGVPGGAEIATHGDHRIAMSFLVLGLGAKTPVIVDEAEMIATSFPGFAAFMGALGAEIVEV
jgi:3-phosphoshikimate 1-carboxyvinyltransferase